MSDALDKLNANKSRLALELDAHIERLVGRKLKFTLLVWDDVPWSSGVSEAKQNPDRYGLSYAFMSSLPNDLLPECLRRVADRFEAKKPDTTN